LPIANQTGQLSGLLYGEVFPEHIPGVISRMSTLFNTQSACFESEIH